MNELLRDLQKVAEKAEAVTRAACDCMTDEIYPPGLAGPIIELRDMISRMDCKTYVIEEPT